MHLGLWKTCVGDIFVVSFMVFVIFDAKSVNFAYLMDSFHVGGNPHFTLSSLTVIYPICSILWQYKKTYFHWCSHRGKSDVITKRIHRYLLTPLSYILEGFERMKYMKRMLSSACKITGGSSYLEFISLTSTDSLYNQIFLLFGYTLICRYS